MTKISKRSARNKSKADTIQKGAEGLNTTTSQRASKKQITSAGIKFIQRQAQQFKAFELGESRRLKTYQLMLQDDAVFSAINDRMMAIETSQANGKFEFDHNSEESVAIKDFLEYNMSRLIKQTPRSIGRCAAEMIINGWSPFELVTHRDDKEYKNNFVIKKLAYIHPLTLDTGHPYVVADGGDEIIKLNQSAAAFMGNDGTYTGVGQGWTGRKEIDFRRVVYSSYSGTSAQPMGQSPLDAAYIAWREKQLFQDYLAIGVSRDMAGMPLLRIPSEDLAEAAADPSGAKAVQVAQMIDNMGNMHSGDAPYMVLPSNTQSESGTGALDYDMKFVGVEGSGKSFDLTAIIEQKKKAIYSVMSSPHLITGENGGGSFNLLEGQASMQAMHVGRDCEIIEEMWNKQVFPLLLDLNSWEYEEKHLPKWKSGEILPVTIDTFGKAINRVKPFLTCTPKTVNAIMKGIGLKGCEVDENMSTEELRKIMITYVEPALPSTSSAMDSSDGEGSSGTGDTQDGGLGSDLNADNAE